jgi:uncharacterized protein (TIGR01244 family)
MSKIRLFVISVLLTTIGLSVLNYAKSPGRTAQPAPPLVPMADGIFLTSQLKPEQFRSLQAQGIRTLIDIRPDGEDKDQPSSSRVRSAAFRSGIAFHYIPVPHESIPESAVDELSETLRNARRPCALYCRTGRRAARIFALSEASRADGPTTEALIEMVRVAGFSADDLRERIEQSVSNRSSIPAPKNE